MKTANFPRSNISGSYGNFPFETDERDWLISVNDIGSEPVKVNTAKFDKILFLTFNDVDLTTVGSVETPKAVEVLKHLGAPTNEQILQIVNFIKLAKQQEKNVWVNCHAGICRSGAIVRVLYELGWDLADKYSPTRLPNMLLYNKIRKHFPELQFRWEAPVKEPESSGAIYTGIDFEKGI